KQWYRDPPEPPTYVQNAKKISPYKSHTHSADCLWGVAVCLQRWYKTKQAVRGTARTVAPQASFFQCSRNFRCRHAWVLHVRCPHLPQKLTRLLAHRRDIDRAGL